jgi:hypothetical protein
VDDCFIGGGIDRSNCLLEAAAENYSLSIKSMIDAKSVLLSVLINPEKEYLNALRYIDVVSLNRFFDRISFQFIEALPTKRRNFLGSRI